MAIDYGTKRVGLAVCDEPAVGDAALFLPYPLATVNRSRSVSHDLAEILRLAGIENVTAIVVGLPLHADGSHGASAQAATEFANALRKRTALPVEMFNEYGTTVDAQEMLLAADVRRAKRRVAIDRMAAASILLGYLRHRADANRATPESKETV